MSSSIVSRVSSRRSATGNVLSTTRRASSRATEQQLAAGQLARQLDVSARVARGRRTRPAPVRATPRPRPCGRWADACACPTMASMTRARSPRLPRQLQRAGRVRDRLLGQAGIHGRIASGRVELALLGGIGRDLERPLEETQGLDERAQRPRPLGRATQRDPGLGGDRVALRTIGLRPVGGDVVFGQRPGDALVVERLEVARSRQVEPAAVARGQGAVRDLSDEALDEAVLAPLRRPRVGLQREHLASHEAAQARRRPPRRSGR